MHISRSQTNVGSRKRGRAAVGDVDLNLIKWQKYTLQLHLELAVMKGAASKIR